MSRAAGVSRAPAPAGLPVPVRRPRQLTVRQQLALRELVALGADLGSDFTATELRGAYWRLARRYHPDRHPTSPAAEKARLAGVFAGLSESHRRLLPALQEPASPRLS